VDELSIYVEAVDRTFSEVSRLLTLEDAKELYAYLGGMVDALEQGEKDYHAHVCDADNSHEIMLISYSPAEENTYSDRFKKVIDEDK
jgi:hypothetical protein